MTIKKNYIAGAWVEGAGTSHNVNPADTSDIVGEYATADVEQTSGPCGK